MTLRSTRRLRPTPSTSMRSPGPGRTRCTGTATPPGYPLLTLNGINSTRVLLFHGHPALLGCPDTAVCTSVDERPLQGSLTGWEIDDCLLRAVTKTGEQNTLEQVRREWVENPLPGSEANAFGAPPCGLAAKLIVHSLLPPLGADPDTAQLLVMHAYRNVFEVLSVRGDRCLALPVLGADAARGDLPVALFVRTLLAALAAFGQDLQEVYLCPHTHEVSEAIRVEVLDMLRSPSADSAEQAR